MSTTELPRTDPIPVVRPADGTTIESVPIDSPVRVAQIAADLRAAQPAWEALPFEERARWLGKLRDWLLSKSGDKVVDLMRAEAGKVRAECMLELGWVSDIINTYSRSGKKLLGEQNVRPKLPLFKHKRFTLQRRPYELVGVIGPWNFPVVLTFGDAVPALLSGAAVMIKPSEVTPLALREVVRGWREIGAPPVLTGVFGGRETGEALVDEVDMVQFTGSVATGKAIARHAAETLTPTCLELGGKDPMIVTSDSDLERAVNAATWGGFVNSGQVCISIERAYVEAPVYADFVDRVTAKVKSLRQGVDKPGAPCDIGAMITPAQLKIVDEHVQDAIAKGARVTTGGRPADRDGDWYEPTVLADVDHTMRIMREETFGPVLPIMQVANSAEAIRWANDSEFGLAASVFAGKAQDGIDIARQVDSGTVNVNDALVAAMCIDVPMGGWKASGMGGARSGPYGMLKYTRVKTISSPLLPAPKNELAWFPYSPAKTRAFQAMYRFFNARGLRERLGIR